MRFSQAPSVCFWGQTRGMSSPLCTLDSEGTHILPSCPLILCLAAGGESGKLVSENLGV